MQVELTLLPTRGSTILASAHARTLSLVRQSGLAHAFTPAGARVEGEDEEVWALLWQLHELLGDDCGVVVTEKCRAGAQPAEREHAARC